MRFKQVIAAPLSQSIVLLVLTLALVAATGGEHSALTSVLYLPVLLAALRCGAKVGFGLGLIVTLCFFVRAAALGPAAHVSDLLRMAFSYPIVAACAGLFSREVHERNDALDNRARELSTLLDMSQMMDAAFDLDMTLNLILLNVQQLTGCQVCAVYLKDPLGQNLELRGASGARDRRPTVTSLPVRAAMTPDWSVAGTVSLDHAIASCYEPETGRRDAPFESLLYHFDPRVRSFACVPLTSVEGLLGMLYVGCDQPHGLTSDGIERLERMAVRAAFPLQRVLLQQDFQSLAFTDAMTGLDNFRRFEQNLADEVRRAERYSHTLSVILLDIDHFKQFNDRLGHPAGDALLAQLAVVLRNTLRHVDKPARYGGEEFAVICPETGSGEARLIAERIRRTISETAFSLVDGDAQTKSHVTVSVGYATYPQDAGSARSLVQRADAALYAAKAAGRNAACGPEDSDDHRMIA